MSPIAAAALAAYGVEFVVVGGCALVLLGLQPRCGDLDIVPATSPDNIVRLCAALDTLGATRRLRAESLSEQSLTSVNSPYGRVDILVGRARAEFHSLLRHGVTCRVWDVDVRVAAVRDVRRLRARIETPTVWSDRTGIGAIERAVLEALDDLGARPDRPHRKSANVIGRVYEASGIGPQFAYGAACALAAPWLVHLRLIDFHGNLGGPDEDDEPAAPRYTEIRLSKAGAFALRGRTRPVAAPSHRPDQRRPQCGRNISAVRADHGGSRSRTSRSRHWRQRRGVDRTGRPAVVHHRVFSRR